MTPDILSRIVAVNPRAVATTLLSYLIEMVGARGGAVLALKKGGLIAFAEKTSLQGIGLALTMWEAGLPALATGSKSGDRDLCLMPLTLNGLLVGAVWLEGVDPRTCDMGDLAHPFAAAIVAPTMPLGDDLAEMEEEEFVKRKTLTLLENNEWNVARVARLMKITRRTIYMRLDRWDIPRKKIKKGPLRRKRLAPSGA